MTNDPARTGAPSVDATATYERLAQVRAALRGEAQVRETYTMRSLFPETGPYRRELYPRHMEFIGAGQVHRERCFLAGNRVGKSVLGAYETTAHVSGLYPAWWHGRKFGHPIKAWAAGTTKEKTREIVQVKLLGETGHYGTGMIPAHMVHHVSHKAGGTGAADTVWVKYQNAVGDVVGLSQIAFKSYDQGRTAFEGTEQDLIWLDEEPPQDVYTECLMRTMTTEGLILATFTPLEGMTPLILQFVQPATAGESYDQAHGRLSSVR